MTEQSTSAVAHTAVNSIPKHIDQVVIGQREVIEQTFIALLAGGHVLIDGIPGLAKTLLARCFAKAIGGDYNRVQFTPDLMPTDITGHAIFDFQKQAFHIQKGPIFCHILLADEINRAPAKTQSALLEAMQEQQATFEGQSHALPNPFMVFATQNPIEQDGTYNLPQAQLDRFLLKVKIDYPGAEAESAILKNVTTKRVGNNFQLDNLPTLIEPSEFLTLQQQVAAIHVDDQLYEYVVAICQQSRQFAGLQQGAGPRGSIALMRAGKAAAVLAGRDFVIPDDIQRVALPCLRHRLFLSAEYEIEGQQLDHVIEKLLASIPAPRV